MKILFALNSVFESIFALLAIVAPQVVWSAGDALALANGRASGCGALTVAVLGILVLRNLDDRKVARVAIGAVLAWHLALTCVEGLAAYQHLAPPPVAIIHGAFAIAFAVFLVRGRGAGAPAPAP